MKRVAEIVDTKLWKLANANIHLVTIKAPASVSKESIFEFGCQQYPPRTFAENPKKNSISKVSFLTRNHEGKNLWLFEMEQPR